VIEQQKTNPDQIFTRVEVDATFKGGPNAWAKYLERNLNAGVGPDNGAPPGIYKVIIQFVVSKTGVISDVRALTNFGYGMEEEAVRVIRKGPDWEPAIQNGNRVNAYRQQPITFKVE
jgi:periplasmic protein TonB